MTTFTTRDGATTCDHCKTPVGRTWRQRAQHVCPNVITRARRTQQPEPETRRDAWFDDAACNNVDPELFSPTGSQRVRRLKALAVIAEFCDHCPVKASCLDDALERERGKGSSAMEGIRGGLGVTERARILRTERTAS